MSDDHSTLQKAVREIFSTHAGEHVMKYLMTEYVYNRNPQEAYACLFESGQKDVVLDLFHLSNADLNNE